MAKSPVRSKSKSSTAKRMGATLKPGDTVEASGIYRSESSKSRATFTKGEQAPPTPLKNERWNLVAATTTDAT